MERNHLEWRLDPSSDARLSWVTGYGHRIIVICIDGYTSSLAAAALLDQGLHRATDVISGFRACNILCSSRRGPSHVERTSSGLSTCGSGSVRTMPVVGLL